MDVTAERDMLARAYVKACEDLKQWRSYVGPLCVALSDLAGRAELVGLDTKEARAILSDVLKKKSTPVKVSKQTEGEV